MARYRIDDSESTLSIEIKDVGGHEDELVETFSQCHTGQCSCPTNEYGKLASMEVERGDDLIRLRLQPKPGERFETSEIAACLDYTAVQVEKANVDV